MATNRDLTWKLGVQDNASQGFSKLADSSESMSARVGKSISSIGDKIGGELGDLLNKGGDAFTKFAEKSGNAGAKIAAAGVGIAGVGLALQSFAAKGEQAEAQLKVAVDNTGDSFSDYEKKVSSAESAGARFGDTNTDVANALQILVQATGDTEYSLQLLGTAYDLAAAKHESLNDAVSQLAKIYNGSGGKILKSLGIDATVTAGNVDQAKAAIQQVAGVVNGQAAASVDNFNGKINEGKAYLQDFAEKAAAFAGGPMTYLGTAATISGAAIQFLELRADKAKDALEATKAATEGAAAADGELAVASDLALGPLALLAAGVAIMGAALDPLANKIGDWVDDNSSAINSLQGLKGATDELSASIQEDGNAFGTASVKVAAAKIQSSGLADTFKGTGITLAQLTGLVGENSQAFNQQVDAWSKAGKITDGQKLALVSLAGPIQKNIEDNKAAAAAVGQLSDGTKTLAVDYTAAVQPLLSVDDAIKLLKGDGEDLAGTEDDMHTGLNNLKSAIDPSTKSLQGFSQGAIDNRKAITDQIDKINALAQKQLDAKVPTDQVTAAMLSNEGQLKATATQLGLNATDVQTLITKYALVPANVSTTITARFDDNQALIDAAAFQTRLSNLNPNIGYVNVGGGAKPMYASGGVIPGAASGTYIVNDRGATQVDEYGGEGYDIGTGRVIPHGQWDQMKRGTSGGSGSVIYNVTINMPTVTAPTAADGQRVLAAMSAATGQSNLTGKIRNL